MIRLFDLLFSFVGIIVLMPLFLILSLVVWMSGPGPILFRQVRIGQHEKEFELLKFRTMRPASESLGQLTVGKQDPRITKVGAVLRRYKMDELPQLFNVLKGDMSLVGPRPEVSKYVNLYTKDQKEVLNVRPGITDLASLEFFDEDELLAKQENPVQYYVEVLMPRKIEINRKYIQERSLSLYFKVVLKTIGRIFGN